MHLFAYYFVSLPLLVDLKAFFSSPVFYFEREVTDVYPPFRFLSTTRYSLSHFTNDLL